MINQIFMKLEVENFNIDSMPTEWVQNSEVSGVLVHWVGSGTTVGFMEVFSTDLRPCLPPRWLRPWNSPSPSWLVMGTLVLPYTLLLELRREQKVLMTIFSCYFYWEHFVLLLDIWFSFYLQHFLWNAECIRQCILYKLGTLILGEIYLLILCCNILGERLLKAEKEKCGRYFESEWLPSCRSGRLIPSSLPGITNNSTVS